MYESELFASKIGDACRISRTRNIPKYIGFFDSAELTTAVNIVRNEKLRFLVFGGYDSAERNYICILPEWMSEQDAEFPITPIKFTFNSGYKLSHRDFLGSLMAQGIKRETVGDILVNDGLAVVFVAQNLTDYLLAEISKVGSVGVKAEICENFEFIPNAKFEEKSQTVSSLRLDCVISAICSVGRKNADDLIEGGFVTVNSLSVTKSTYKIKQNDKISVRKYGKFLIDNCSTLTKKQRVVLNYKKYI